MKKVLVILVLVLMLASFCACSYTPSTRFMSRSQVNSLVKEYGTPQAELTLSYETNSKSITVKITYNLLLDKAPLAVTRFIQLANEGFYNNSLIDKYDSTYKYMIMGRYSYKASQVQKDNPMTYYKNTSDVTFKGEFKSNGYAEPKSGYATFSTFALAMYHESSDTDKYFDAANGTLILALANETLNPENYAVFAEMVSVSYQIDDGEPQIWLGKVPSDVMGHLKSFTSTTSRDIYADMTEEAASTKISIMSTRVILHVEILGDQDWSKLPTITK